MAIQRTDRAEKKIVKWDGQLIAGLVSVTEISLEKGVIEVPEFSRIRKVQNGILTLPEITFVYKIQVGNSALTFFKDFFELDETHSCVIQRCDAGGTCFAKTYLDDCECRQYTEPEFDAANPTYAKLTVVMLPYEIRITDSAA